MRLSRPLAIACLAGTSCLTRVEAAEWSIVPTMSLTMDYASNRYLVPQPVAGEGGLLNLDAHLKRATETLVLEAQPSVSLQRYTHHSASDTDNAAINLSSTSFHEYSIYTLGAAYSDLSTLTTELASTGVVQGNTHQQQASASGSWQHRQSEQRLLTMQLGYADVRYVGQQARLLPGYRLPNGSIAERFSLSPLTSVTLGATASQLQSSGPAGTSRDEELSVTLEHSFSDRIGALAAFGRSQRDFEGSHNGGYVGEVQLTRTDERNHWKLSYQRSVVATGFGGLVQRDAAILNLSRPLTARLSGDLSVLSSRDRNFFFFGLLQVGRRYDSAEGGFSWISSETSTIGVHFSDDRAVVSSLVPVPVARGWRAAVSVTWTPRPRSVSR
jgi:hypothetical protein